jgi:hypothetical protein
MIRFWTFQLSRAPPLLSLTFGRLCTDCEGIRKLHAL